MKNIISISIIIAVHFILGCATPQYAWRPAPEKSEQQTRQDLTKCQRASYFVPPGRYGNEQDKFVTNCMYSEGHTLEEVSH